MKSRAWIAAFLVLAAFTGLALLQVERAIDANEHERETRRAVQGEINRWVCVENNRQDKLLAGLLAVTLRGSEKRELTPRQEEARQTFLRALLELRAELPCDAIVRAFLEAQDTDDIRAIREILFARNGT